MDFRMFSQYPPRNKDFGCSGMLLRSGKQPAALDLQGSAPSPVVCWPARRPGAPLPLEIRQNLRLCDVAVKLAQISVCVRLLLALQSQEGTVGGSQIKSTVVSSIMHRSLGVETRLEAGEVNARRMQTITT